MSRRVWNSGPPPFVGWWNASRCENEDAWRWWDGEIWSGAVYPEDSEWVVGRAADIKAQIRGIQWTTYYPENARVERIAP